MTLRATKRDCNIYMWGGMGKGTYSTQVLFWEKMLLKFYKYLGGVGNTGLSIILRKMCLNVLKYAANIHNIICFNKDCG